MATLRTIVFYPSRPLMNWVEAWMARKTVAAEYKGIKICHSAFHLWCNDEFTASMERALRLIDETDPLRFARIQRFIRYVRPISLPGDIAAEYVRSSRLCRVDWKKVPSPTDPSFTVLASAVVLVHESTHGLLFSRGVRHSSARRLLIERVCVLEEVRFLSRVNPEMTEAWLQLRKRDCENASATRSLVTDIREGVVSLKDSLRRNSKKGLSIWRD